MVNIKPNKDIFLFIIILMSLFFTTIVYSAFSTQLQIRGEAIVRSDQVIRISSLKLSGVTNVAYETYNSKYEKDTTSLYATLPASSSMTYEVSITNKDPLLIYRIREILTLINNNPNVTIEYGIKTGDCIASNSTKKFTIKLINNTESDQVLTLITQYKFEVANWAPLEAEFLSTETSGDLSVNKDGVVFEVSVKNLNQFGVNYILTSNNTLFTVIDDTTKNNSFYIDANSSVTHQIRVKLRTDVAYENFIENLKLMVKTTSPISSTTDIKIVELTLPRNFNTIILNSMPINNSPNSFSSIESTNGFLYKINEMTSSSYTYYYRGVINNNYVSFADNLWRIVRVDSKGNVRVVLNDNVESKSKYSSNYSSGSVETIEDAVSLIDYKNSDVRSNVEAWYNQNIATKEANKFVMNSNFCIDKSYKDPINTSFEHSVSYFTPYLNVGLEANKFKPDFTCSNENIFTSSVGLLSAEEVLAAGGYWAVENPNYYLYNPNKSTENQASWTISGSYYSVSEKQVGVIAYNQNDGTNIGSLFDWVFGGNLTQDYGYRPVISLDGNSKVLGDGTLDNPYQILE